jgi:ABC-type sugar transport system ATPase subunit
MRDGRIVADDAVSDRLDAHELIAAMPAREQDEEEEEAT